jgi:hypothetical protein
MPTPWPWLPLQALILPPFVKDFLIIINRINRRATVPPEIKRCNHPYRSTHFSDKGFCKGIFGCFSLYEDSQIAHELTMRIRLCYLFFEAIVSSD